MARSTSLDFDFLEKLGRGSGGVVWKVRRKRDNKIYVIKQVDIGAITEEEVDSAINEVRILASFDCPNIIRYHDSFIEDDLLHIVMEWAENGSLADYLKSQRGKKLPEDLVWKYFVQIALGLYYIHSKKILHRDLKSMNVFLDKDLNAKIGDMGVAKMLETNGKFAKSVVGSPYYLSPELCEGRPYNAKSDVWALGVVLYEMCTGGGHPFEANNQGALIMRILKGKYVPIGRPYSKELSELVKMCLAREPEGRPDVIQMFDMRHVVETVRNG